MVKLYTIDCPMCLVLEKKLKEANIEYETIKDKDIMIKKGITICPVLEVENELLDFEQAIEWIEGTTVGEI